MKKILLQIAINEFVHHLYVSRYAQSTRNCYAITVHEFGNLYPGKFLSDITPNLCIDFLNRRSCSSGTTRAEISRVSKMFERCVVDGFMASNPMKHYDVRSIRPPSNWRERNFTETEMSMFLNQGVACNCSPWTVEYNIFFRLLSETGLRLQEGLRLRYCDVTKDSEGRWFLRVTERLGWKPKSRKSLRSVPLSGMALYVLGYYDLSSDATDLIFPSNWTNRSVNSQFNRILARLGMDGIDSNGEKLVVHTLRHYFATKFISRIAELRMNIAVARDILGHSNFQSLDRYNHAPPEQLFEAIERMN